MEGKKPSKGYWYLVEIYECPVCGNGGVSRTRQYTEKPTRQEDRIKFHQDYDYCMER